MLGLVSRLVGTVLRSAMAATLVLVLGVTTYAATVVAYWALLDAVG